ncbi:MAG: acyl-CoA dehydrogenase, partial [Deltaproteobacteria bacterium]|nr:acyl-CoA dehydrogenase [Deltaproteobacteria bacterium]
MPELKFTQQQEMLRKAVREFVEKEVKPVAHRIDAENHFPTEIFRKMGQLGFAGVFVPQKYGGAGLGLTERAIVLEELGRHAAGFAMALMTHHLGVEAILSFGTDEQKQKYLPDLATGKKVSGLAVTEPTGGSDVAGQKATAARDNGHWVINGRKCFITNSSNAEVNVVTARTGEDAKGRPAFSAFIVETGAEGFSPGREEDKLGLRGSSTGDLLLNNCRVGEASLLGGEGNGMKMALGLFTKIGRTGMAAIGLGIVRACLEEGVKFARERVLYGKPLSKLQAIQFEIAQTRIEYEAARLLTYHSIGLKEAGAGADAEIAAAKYYSCE